MPAAIPYDENFRVYWLTADPLDPDVPLTDEIEDGVDLSGYLVPDGWASNHTEARVAGGDLLTAMDAQAIGRYGAAPALTFKRRLLGGSQLAWETFKVRGAKGCLVAFPFIAKGQVPVAGDECYVYTTCEAGLPMPQNTATNTEQRFIVNFAVGGDIHLGAALAFGS